MLDCPICENKQINHYTEVADVCSTMKCRCHSYDDQGNLQLKEDYKTRYRCNQGHVFYHESKSNMVTVVDTLFTVQFRLLGSCGYVVYHTNVNK